MVYSILHILLLSRKMLPFLPGSMVVNDYATLYLFYTSYSYNRISRYAYRGISAHIPGHNVRDPWRAQNNAAQFKIQTSPPAKAMEPARPIVNLSRDFELSVSEVIGYLKEYGGNAIPTLPPLQPKGGG